MVALRLLDEGGIEALSMERIAREFGVRAPSLYHHFASKSEILTEVARLVLGDLGLEKDAVSWQDKVVRAGVIFYRNVMKHPRSVAILLEHLPDEATIPGFGLAARALTEAGVPSSVQVLVLEGVEKIAWGWMLQRGNEAGRAERRLSPRRIANWPELARVMRESHWTDEELLEATLRSFIEGATSGLETTKTTRRRPR